MHITLVQSLRTGEERVRINISGDCRHGNGHFLIRGENNFPGGKICCEAQAGQSAVLHFDTAFVNTLAGERDRGDGRCRRRQVEDQTEAARLRECPAVFRRPTIAEMDVLETVDTRQRCVIMEVREIAVRLLNDCLRHMIQDGRRDIETVAGGRLPFENALRSLSGNQREEFITDTNLVALLPGRDKSAFPVIGKRYAGIDLFHFRQGGRNLYGLAGLVGLFKRHGCLGGVFPGAGGRHQDGDAKHEQCLFHSALR